MMITRGCFQWHSPRPHADDERRQDDIGRCHLVFARRLHLVATNDIGNNLARFSHVLHPSTLSVSAFDRDEQHHIIARQFDVLLVILWLQRSPNLAVLQNPTPSSAVSTRATFPLEDGRPTKETSSEIVSESKGHEKKIRGVETALDRVGFQRTARFRRPLKPQDDQNNIALWHDDVFF